jgi:hypothetical protein
MNGSSASPVFETTKHTKYTKQILFFALTPSTTTVSAQEDGTTNAVEHRCGSAHARRGCCDCFLAQSLPAGRTTADPDRSPKFAGSTTSSAEPYP